jgi:hypothetical protein
MHSSIRCRGRAAGLLVLAFVVVALLVTGVSASHAQPLGFEIDRPSHTIALALDPDEAGPLGGLPAASETAAEPVIEDAEPGRLWASVELSFAELMPNAGTGEATARVPSERFEALAAADTPFVVAIRGGHPELGSFGPTGLGDGSPESLERYRRHFTRSLRAVARATRDRARWYVLDEVLPHPSAPDAERLAAFELKSAAVALRAENPSAGIAVRVRGEGDLAFLERTFRRAGDLAPYVDGYTAVLPFDERPDATADRLRSFIVDLDPGATLWLESELPPPGTEREEILARAAELVGAGAGLSILRAPDAEPADPSSEALGADLLAVLQRELGPGYQGSTRVRGIEAESDSLRFRRFFDDETFTEQILYWSEEDVGEDARAGLVLGAALRRAFQIFDPLEDRVRLIPTERIDEGRKIRIALPVARTPRILQIRRQAFSPGFEGEVGQVETLDRASITAEEIIAAHQRFRAFQDDRLESVVRKGQMNLQIRYGQFTGTIDVTFDADYLWRRDEGAEWILRETLVEGVRLPWDEVPELPFLAGEEVVQLPLDLELDKRYEYELDGEDEIDGRGCWRLRFRPLEEDVSLYRGRACIDKATAALLEVTSVQTNLTPPLISDEVTQTFRPFTGPDGTEFWILDGVEGQQIRTISGSNLVVLREADFGPPEINREDVDRLIADLHASEAQIIRETDEGFKWLERTEDGRRVVKEEGDSTQLFGVAGLLKDEGTNDGDLIPLAGVNYTDIDFGGDRRLLNVFFAGVFANASLSQPSLFGSRVDLGVTLNALALPGTDRVFEVEPEGGDISEIEEQRIERLAQSLVVNFGYPLGSFFKLRSSARVRYVDYGKADETADGFVVPSDHWQTSGLIELAYDRRGWGFLASAETTRRSKWEAWGPDGDLASERDVERAETFSTWLVSAQKSWSLPRFQKIEFDLSYRQGNDLDRFSAFTFGFLGGERLRGYGGSGIRFESGVLGELEYSFGFGEVVRFEASIDGARIRELGFEEDTEHYGAGIAASFPGPWETLVRLDFGYALDSDLEAVEGDTEILLALLKLF